VGFGGFLGGMLFEEKVQGQVYQELKEVQAELRKTQQELDVFIKYIQPEIDSVFEMSGSDELTRYFFQYGIKTATPPRLLAAVARVESNYTPGVVSRAGASGILQVVPNLWRKLVEANCGPWDRGNARFEICAGAYVFRAALDTFDGNVYNALSWYNSGYAARSSTQGRHYAKEVLSGL